MTPVRKEGNQLKMPVSEGDGGRRKRKVTFYFHQKNDHNKEIDEETVAHFDKKHALVFGALLYFPVFFP